MAKRKPPAVIEPEETVHVYLGPTIGGKIQNGAIFIGSRAEVLAQLLPVTQQFPLVKNLLVPLSTLAEDRIKVKTTGNALFEFYNALAGKR